MGTRDGAIRRARAAFDDGSYLANLRKLVAIRSESQIPEQRSELHRYCSEGVRPLLAALNFETTLLSNPAAEGGPAILGSRIEDKSKPTILIYGHGDVVRGFDSDWTNNRSPWDVTIDGDRLYGRGVSDNKGQHLIAIEALRAVVNERGKFGCNVKVLIETGEEIGSPGLRDLLAKHRDQCAADLFIGVDGPRQHTQIPEIRLGGRGITAFDLVVKLRDAAHHSGHWGGILPDPGFILSHALSSIVSAEGKILVSGWRAEGIPTSVRGACANLILEETPNMPEPDPNWGEPGLSKVEKIFAWTSVIVLAFITGHPDAPANAVQPEARARVQVRHTVDIKVEDIVPALRRHLDAHGFAQVQINPVARSATFPAARTDPSNPWVQRIAQSMERTMGRAPNIVPNSSGGNPSQLFIDALGVPTVWIPNSYSGCRQHAPDEHIPISLVRDGLANLAGVVWDVGAT